MSEGERFGGKVALVTGASSGLGRATAIALAEVGFGVVLVARSKEDLEEVNNEIEAAGSQALALPVDLADEGQVQEAVGRILETFGGVDLLVNAAGTDAPSPVEELEVDGWDRTLDVNLRAPFLLSKAIFPHMREAGDGTIINISSVAGKKGWAGAAAYCASKFGLTGFSQALAEEGRPHGIRVCILYPGAMATNWGAWTPEERRESDGETASPSQALPPERIADYIVWFASSPPEFVLTEGIITPIEESLP